MKIVADLLSSQLNSIRQTVSAIIQRVAGFIKLTKRGIWEPVNLDLVVKLFI